jgi:hypothetical protein
MMEKIYLRRNGSLLGLNVEDCETEANASNIKSTYHTCRNWIGQFHDLEFDGRRRQLKNYRL